MQEGAGNVESCRGQREVREGLGHGQGMGRGKRQLGGDFHIADGAGGPGGANKIRGTASHLSTLQPVTDEQSRSGGEAEPAQKGLICWLEGVVGGQLSVTRPCKPSGHTCSPLHRAG